MSKPVISILTPFKNSSIFLPECLESIIQQTYRDWELLIVDDNSTDNSYAVVNQFVQKDSRIKLFKNSDTGIINALRLAFDKSSGTYVTRMDSDDLMHPEKLAIMLNDLQTHGKKHMALGLVKYFSETGIGNGYAKYESWLNTLTKNGTNYSDIYKECVIPSPCWMLHREDLIACDAFNPERYPEDYDLAFRCYKNNIKCIPSNSLLHYWRDYSTRASRTDSNYADNHFLSIKLHYFLELNYNALRPLTVWGAGQKGKTTAKLLQKAGVDFIWICDNPKKIGKHIYDVKLYNFEHLKTLRNPQSIITVANSKEQEIIKLYLESINMAVMNDYIFFC
ncbi:glycosyltransferase family 2 protein [Psychroserpens ponticola]|uniref:Glycosyltransferase family 2 protein n=1 Tax=Psychroserpens ponticola TaxID=2932268 RepID=A0ABY7S2Q5_9FLAO|nr:glycosyltransferase family 2 protein [Psychroserpens ponticola]WCO02746.1 glycosyltransferase family 2 protein [Psychroserpens ponticola]